MPSQRRLKTFGLLVFIGVLVTLYITASARQTRSSDFYSKTQDALQAARAHKEQAFGADSDDVGTRLREAEEAAKKAADKKGDAFHGEEGKRRAEVVMSKTNEREAQRSMSGRKIRGSGSEAVLREKESPKTQEQTAETEEEHKVKDELNDILKKSPIIIFSKSYCPHSAKAKGILLENYTISPPPHVVELDLHDLGPQLQAKLAEMTGRRTVPNILVNGRSIGGGDEVSQLDANDELADKIRSMGGKRMTVSRKEQPKGEDKKRRRKRA